MKNVPRLPSLAAEPSQEDKILQCLRAYRPRWVPMPHLAAISGSMNIHTRINGLRDKGFSITNCLRTKRDSRSRDSFYRLDSEPGEQTPEQSAPQTELFTDQ